MSKSYSGTVSPSKSNSRTALPSLTPSITPTHSETSSTSHSPTQSPTSSHSLTRSRTPSRTPTESPSPTKSDTPTGTPTHSGTGSGTPTTSVTSDLFLLGYVLPYEGFEVGPGILAAFLLAAALVALALFVLARRLYVHWYTSIAAEVRRVEFGILPPLPQLESSPLIGQAGETPLALPPLFAPSPVPAPAPASAPARPRAKGRRTLPKRFQRSKRETGEGSAGGGSQDPSSDAHTPGVDGPDVGWEAINTPGSVDTAVAGDAPPDAVPPLVKDAEEGSAALEASADAPPAISASAVSAGSAGEADASSVPTPPLPPMVDLSRVAGVNPFKHRQAHRRRRKAVPLLAADDDGAPSLNV